MGTNGGLVYNGMRLYDYDGELLNSGIMDTESSEWSTPQKIPDGLRLVGFGCSPTDSSLWHLKFNLAKLGEIEVIDQIYFPPLLSYPSRTQFDLLYLPE